MSPRLSFYYAAVVLCCSCTSSNDNLANTQKPAVDALDPETHFQSAEERMTNSCSPNDQFVAIPKGRILDTTDFAWMDINGTLANPTSILLNDNTIRLYFWAASDENAQFNGIKSATSSNGLDYAIESGTRIPRPYGIPKLLGLTNGNIRMYHGHKDGLASSVSTDGLGFSLEPGTRISNAQAGFERTGPMTVIKAPDATYRAYFSNLEIAETEPVASAIKSATSPDAIEWTVDPASRIGDNAPSINSWAMDPFAIARKGQCVTLFYHVTNTRPTRIHYATASDGITFTQAHILEIQGWESDAATPHIQRLPQGGYALYFEAQSEEVGKHIHLAELNFLD